MSPIQWAVRPLKKYATFSGRAPRAELWWFFLAVFVVYFGLSFVLGVVLGVSAAGQTEPSTGMLASFGATAIFILLFWLALLIPSLAVQVRRLHDTNRSGWWLGAFYLLYVLYMVLLFGLVGSAALGANAGEAPSQSFGAMFGGLMIFGFAFFIYAIVLIVFYCLPGTNGPNKYGDDPYGGKLDEVFA